MNLYVYTNKVGQTFYYVKNSYRDKNGRSTSKIVEKLGTHDELLKTHSDPLAWAKEYVAELNRKDKEQKLPVNLSCSPSNLIPQDQDCLYHGGYLFLQDIFYSLGLNKICSEISKRHGFRYNLIDILAKLIYGRILFPTSKAGTYEESQKLMEKPRFSQHDIYRALEVLSEESDFIQSELYKNSGKTMKRNDGILYYDCTNYFFEIEEEKGIRKYGMSKEHRPNPIVQMGMFIDGDGIPMAFSVFSGNENEQGSLKPLEQKIINDFDKAKFIVCTDAGLSGMANRRFNSIQNRSFITAQSIKKMKDFQKDWALAPHGWRIVGKKELFNIADILADEVLCAKYHDTTFYKETWWNEDGLEQRYIVTYSIKYMEYLRNIREKQLQRAQKKLERGDVGRKGQNDPERFCEQLYFTTDGEIASESATAIDMDKVRSEEQYDGFYCVATDLEDDAALILKANARRWEIEESFRIMKTDFRSRPVYLQRDERIAAHFLTCFLALFVYRVLEKRLNERFTTTEILKTLREYKLYRVEGEGWLPCYKRTKITDALHEAFGFRTDYQINTNAMMKKIFHTTKI